MTSFTTAAPPSGTASNRDIARRIDAIVDRRLKAGNYRHEIAAHVPEGSRNIMEFGYWDASLLLGLRRDKGCRGIYGVEIDERAVERTRHMLDKAWLMDLCREDCDLEPEYHGFFNYILAPMSLEHISDPWYVLKKFSRYLRMGGKVVAEVPNVQSWECLYRILTGDFPYVSGGTWDYRHIRWYTLKSLSDMAFVAGMRITAHDLRFPHPMDFTAYHSQDEIRTLRLPPAESVHGAPPLEVSFPFDIKPIYPLFLAHALVVVMEKVREPEDCLPTPADGYLESYRLVNDSPLRAYSDLMEHPIVPAGFKKAMEKAERLRADLSG